MKPLYELAHEFAMVKFDEEGAEERLNALQVDFESKVQNICIVIKEREAEQEALGKEIARLTTKARVAKKDEDWLRNYLKVNMDAAGIPKIKTTLFGVSLSDSRPKINITAIGEVPKEFVNTAIVTTADKEKILEHFKKTGEVLQGCQIEQGKTLRIS